MENDQTQNRKLQLSVHEKEDPDEEVYEVFEISIIINLLILQSSTYFFT